MMKKRVIHFAFVLENVKHNESIANGDNHAGTSTFAEFIAFSHLQLRIFRVMTTLSQ
jgi:hypothetical protein